jgi:hypothetical protein
MQVEGMGRLGTCRIFAEPMGSGDCKFVFYKNPADTPEEFYTRIGKKKKRSNN